LGRDIGHYEVAFERHGVDAQKVLDIPGETYPYIGETGDWLNKPSK
jgi:hypothetical protein